MLSRQHYPLSESDRGAFWAECLAAMPPGPCCVPFIAGCDLTEVQGVTGTDGRAVIRLHVHVRRGWGQSASRYRRDLEAVASDVAGGRTSVFLDFAPPYPAAVPFGGEVLPVFPDLLAAARIETLRSPVGREPVPSPAQSAAVGQAPRHSAGASVSLDDWERFHSLLVAEIGHVAAGLVLGEVPIVDGGRS
jgi:hypothetical protein